MKIFLTKYFLKLFISLLLIHVILFSCKDKPTEPINLPPEKEDIVQQTDIPWPSLADTPWPMYHHDPQSTGRSKYVGPQLGTIEAILFDNFDTMSGISIGYNKIAFLPSGDFAHRFVAFDYEGNPIWDSDFSCISTPLISSDSTVFVASAHGTFFAFNHVGDTLWTADSGTMFNIGINIDKDGNLYFVHWEGRYPNSINTLKVLDNNGKILWTLQDNRILGSRDSAPTFSPDGNILYLQGKDVSVIAIDIKTKSIKWIFGDKSQLSAPVIDNNGNLYFIPGEISSNDERKLYSLNPEGEINWEFNFSSNKVWDNTEPTIDYDGNIYFGGDTLFSVTNNGQLRWKKYLEEGTIMAPLICDKNNDIYIGLSGSEDKIYAFTNNGELKWQIDNLPFRTLGACPALTDEGTILFPSWRNGKLSLSIIR